MLQQQKLKLAIYGLIIALVIIASAFIIYYFQAQARDYRRLADLKLWQAVLSDYYLRNGTYVVATCQPEMTLSSCLPYKNSDPLGTGDYRYVVAGLSDTDFSIRFALETGLGGLQPGSHLMTKNGVNR